MSVLKKIVFSQKQTVQFWLSIGVLLIGLFSSLLSIVLFIDFSDSGQANDAIFGDNSIVIQKKVTRMTSMGLNSTDFSEEDIENIKAATGVLDVGTFQSANYEVGISENPGDGLPGFYTNMFLQSVPNHFIKGVDSLNWEWTPSSPFVPVILPRNFLVLVNYGIAPSQGLPQVSEGFIKSVRLRLHLIGGGQKGVKLAKVVGFSSQINAVLVPEAFIQSTNQIYGNGSVSAPNRLFIKVDPAHFASVKTLMENMNLDISESALDISKLKSYVRNVIFFILIFSILILLMAILNLIQYFQIMIIHLKIEIRHLLQLGYLPQSISGLIQKRLVKTIGVLVVIAMVGVALTKWVIIEPILMSNGIAVDGLSLIYGILFAILMLILFIFVVKLETNRSIHKVSKD